MMKTNENSSAAKEGKKLPSTQLKKYESPKFYVYGEIERQTQGGSGMTKEGIGSAANKFP